MWDGVKILKDMFPRLSRAERTLFSGTRAQEIAQFANDFHNANGINPAHLSYFFNLVDDFYAASSAKSTNIINDVRFDNDRLSPGSMVKISGWGVSAEDRRGKSLVSLNKFTAIAENAGFFMAARPYPVKWHLDHIKHRMQERNPSRNTDIMFSEHNIVALAMLRIFEEEHVDGSIQYHPFVLPERGGIILGHTMRTAPEDSFNRVHLTLAKDFESLTLSPYVWMPGMHIIARTFINMAELSPQMQRLRGELLKFYTPARIQALDIQIPLFVETKKCDFFDKYPQKEAYMSAMVDLADLMAGPLWQKAVKLPMHLRANLAPAHDEIRPETA